MITDKRLSAIGTEQRAAYRDRLKTGRGFDRQHHDLVRTLQAEQRRHRNEPRGYWIAADDPAAADQAVTRSFPVTGVGAVALMTDGASAIVDRFGLTAWTELPTRFSHDGCAAVLAAVDRAEHSDPMGLRWPRSKVHDDKTVVLVADQPLRPRELT